MPISPTVTLGVRCANATSAALEASHVVSAAACRVVQINAYNDKASAQYIQLHDAATLPADTAVPVYTISVPTKTAVLITWGMYGRHNSTGAVVCNSSTAATKTIGSADCWFDVQYR